MAATTNHKVAHSDQSRSQRPQEGRRETTSRIHSRVQGIGESAWWSSASPNSVKFSL